MENIFRHLGENGGGTIQERIRNAVGGFSCSLKHDGEGRWSNTVGGVALPALDGCTTVDLAGSVLTNTLPLRAARLGAGESSEVLAVWIDGPRDGMPRAARQRYDCIALHTDTVHGDTRTLRYRNLSGTADLTLTTDADGYVLDYPGVARRTAG